MSDHQKPNTSSRIYVAWRSERGGSGIQQYHLSELKLMTIQSKLRCSGPNQQTASPHSLINCWHSTHQTHLSLVTPIRLMLLTSKIRSPDLSRPGTESDDQTDVREDQITTVTVFVFPQKRQNTKNPLTVQSCQPAAYHTLDVDAKLFPCQLSVTSSYLHTCVQRGARVSWETFDAETSSSSFETRGSISSMTERSGGRYVPRPFLQSQNSSLCTARLMPCGPMIVLATSKYTTDSKTYQHPAWSKASLSLCCTE